MRKGLRNGIFFATLLSMFACYPPPEFPEEPEISFESLRYVSSEEGRDSLVLVIGFRDGNGDVGLENSESFFPYHAYSYIVDSAFNLVSISSDSRPPFYILDPTTNNQVKPEVVSSNSNVTLFSETDNRPAFDCDFYEIITSDDGNRVDTCYVVRNKYAKNIFVRFEVKRNGSYEPFNFDESVAQQSGVLCGNIWDGRFPILDEINFEAEKPLAGSLEYAMSSNGFELNLRNDIFRIQVHIVDRNLNESNIIYTPDFTIFPEFQLNP